MPDKITLLPDRTLARKLFDNIEGYSHTYRACNPGADAARERISQAAEHAIEVILEPLLAENRRLQQRIDDLTRERPQTERGPGHGGM